MLISNSNIKIQKPNFVSFIYWWFWCVQRRGIRIYFSLVFLSSWFRFRFLELNLKYQNLLLICLSFRFTFWFLQLNFETSELLLIQSSWFETLANPNGQSGEQGPKESTPIKVTLPSTIAVAGPKVKQKFSWYDPPKVLSHPQLLYL
jgi:hypothetical protein